MSGRAAIAAACLVGAPLSLATPTAAQSWETVDGIGYAAAGAALGGVLTAAAVSDCGVVFCGVFEVMLGIGVGALAGSIAGTRIGERADRAIARQQPVGAGHRAAVALGALFGGAGLGVAIAVRLEDPSAGDASTGPLGVGAALGAVASTVFLWHRWDELTGPVDVRSSVDAGRWGVELRLAH